MTEPFAFIKIKPSPENMGDDPSLKRHFDATRSLLTAIGGLLASEHTELSLELAAKGDTISFLAVCQDDLKGQLVHHLYAALPQAELEDLDSWTLFDTEGPMAAAQVEFSPDSAPVLSSEFGGSDPLQPVLEVLSSTGPNDRLCCQLVLEPRDIKHGLAARAIEGIHETMTQGLRLNNGPTL